jgi:hypothetical protein
VVQILDVEAQAVELVRMLEESASVVRAEVAEVYLMHVHHRAGNGCSEIIYFFYDRIIRLHKFFEKLFDALALLAQYFLVAGFDTV